MLRHLLLLCALLAACAGPGDAPPIVRPNIVLIMADDVGVEAFATYGGTSYATPHLDALADEGMLFRHCYSQPLCTPSRVKLMTGRGNLRNYVHFSILERTERTFAHLAKEAGYATAVAGKWQLRGAEQYGEWAGRGASPREAGFDHWCLWQVDVLGSRYQDPTVDVDGELRRDIAGAFGPDVYCDYLLDFAAAHRDEPFLAYFPMALVHNPFVRTPLSKEGELTKQQRFADMMAYMDLVVGRLRAGLEELGLAENTLLLFTSDNGTNTAITSMANGREVRGGKGLPTDAGTHVPLLAAWPGHIARGTGCEDLVDFSDFLPTLADAMGITPPDDRVLDGVSFLPQLEGRPGTPRETITIYSNPRPERSLREPAVRFARDWRYKLYADGRFLDCVADPLEEQPLTDPGPAARESRRRLERALAAMPEEPPHLRPSGSR